MEDTLLSQPKAKPVRDKAYLAYIRGLDCLICGYPSHLGATQPHHEAEKGHGTLAGKTSDRRVIPLCGVKCHPLRHSKGRSFWGKIDVEKVIAELNAAYDKRRK